jgi:ABC-type nitrate/sulfonate/bicarbonate transport system substrate-binding protein
MTASSSPPQFAMPLLSPRSTILTWTFLIGALTTGAAPAAEPLRLGWQTPWATQGQLVAVMQKTNIPQLVGLDLSYVGFSYGAPLNRAALAGQVDLLLTADQPAAALVDKGARYRIVARMMYNRTCLYSHPASRVTAIEQLQRARILGPSGAAAERVALKLLSDAKVDASKIQWGDLDMTGQAALVRADQGAWPGVEALYGFDPLPADWQARGKIRMLGCGTVTSFVLASTEVIEGRAETLARFLKAFSLAWGWYAAHPEQANAWFREISGLDIPDAALEESAAVEPNKSAKHLTEINLDVSAKDEAAFAEAAGFLRGKGLIGTAFPGPAFAMQPYRAVRLTLPQWQALATRVAPR